MDRQRITKLTEGLHTVFLHREPDMCSPYKIYGNPPMWNILEHNGRTLAARPAATQLRTLSGWNEVPGVTWGWHKDGEWLRGEQHMNSTFENFVMKVIEPFLGAGADPVRELLGQPKPVPALPAVEMEHVGLGI
ncbi:hypothetical protein ACEUZ9_004076 [Paracoccus litorisediminis]|uniref:hypothetical protein n=1 Tax=Paracoccus litorisediminis TaxID=2006130 RepID=UPI00372FC7C6